MSLPQILALLSQVSRQITELEKRIESLEVKLPQNKLLDLVLPDYEGSDTESETSSSEGYQSAPDSFWYKEQGS